MTDLFSYTTPLLPTPLKEKAFHGATYDDKLDHGRLRGQLWRVFQLMSDGCWRTLPEIAEHAGGSEASVSARLRDLRKHQYGARQIERRRVSGGLFKYRMVPINITLVGGA